MRKRFCMVVALIVALSVPLRLSALAAEASDEQTDEVSVEQSAEVSEVQTVEEFPAVLFGADGAEVRDVSWLSQTYSFGSGKMGEITLSFKASSFAVGGNCKPYYAIIKVGSQVYYFPYVYNNSNYNENSHLFTLEPNSSGGYIIRFGTSSSEVPFIQDLWTFISLLCLCNGGYTFSGVDGESIDYTAILNQILEQVGVLKNHFYLLRTSMESGFEQVMTGLNQLVTGITENSSLIEQVVAGNNENSSLIGQVLDSMNILKGHLALIRTTSESGFEGVSQLLNQVITGNAAVQQAVKDMQAAMVEVITSTTTAVDNLGDELQQRFDDVTSTLDEGLTAQAEVMKDMNGRLDGMETALKDSVGGSFQIDASASGTVDSVGTEGFAVISSTLDQMLSTFSWISSLVAVFLMIVLAKRILT